MSKGTKVLAAVTAIVVAVLMISTTVMTAVLVIRQNKMDNVISAYMGNVEDPAQEDDVVIGQHYTIKSTTKISDAYKSGDTSKLDDRDKETLAMAKDVLKEIITDDMDTFKKEEAVYRYLTTGLKPSTSILTVIADTSNDNDNPHDVLKNRSAVCVGFATTFRLFMQMLDIECKVVHSSTLGHSWDLVKLDDGCWYHTDCYMDSEYGNYKNFNMDDFTCTQLGHEWNTGFFPAASGKKYNYLMIICQEIKDIYAIPKFVMEGVKNREPAVSCTFKNKISTPEEEILAKYMVEQLDNSLEGTDKFYSSSQWTTNENGDYVLCYFLSFNDNATSSLSEKQKSKIENRINDVLNQYKFFGNMYN